MTTLIRVCCVDALQDDGRHDISRSNIGDVEPRSHAVATSDVNDASQAGRPANYVDHRDGLKLC
jgi:hypothetical protein